MKYSILKDRFLQGMLDYCKGIPLDRNPYKEENINIFKGDPETLPVSCEMWKRGWIAEFRNRIKVKRIKAV